MEVTNSDKHSSFFTAEKGFKFLAREVTKGDKHNIDFFPGQAQ